MQTLLKKFNSSFFLRSGLGLMLLFLGYETVANPLSQNLLLNRLTASGGEIFSKLPPEASLRVLGLVEIILAVALLLWFLPRRLVFWSALVISLGVIILIFLIGLSVKTIWLAGILGSALALSSIYRRQW